MPLFNKSYELNAEAIHRIAKTKTGLNFFYKYTGRRGSFQATTDATGNFVVKPTFTSAYHYADASIQQYINRYLHATAGVRNLFNVTDIQNNSSGTGAHSSSGALAFSYGRSYYLTFLSIL